MALCGGVLADRHVWLFDAVDVPATWNEMRGLPNRSEAATLPMPPLRRVLAGAEVKAETKARLAAGKQTRNPFALRREGDRQLTYANGCVGAYCLP